MNRPLHVCPACHWRGHDPHPFDEDLWSAVRDGLRPGETAPTGLCPICRSKTFPALDLKAEFTGSSDSEPQFWHWDARITKEEFLIRLLRENQGSAIRIRLCGPYPQVEISGTADTINQDFRLIARFGIGASSMEPGNGSECEGQIRQGSATTGTIANSPALPIT